LHLGQSTDAITGRASLKKHDPVKQGKLANLVKSIPAAQTSKKTEMGVRCSPHAHDW
jgi:hypothetical protein